MRAATVEDIAQEFMRIIAEGWSPDPEEFLHRVPEDLREECRQRLNELLVASGAAPPDAALSEPEPEGIEEDVIFFELETPVAAKSEDPAEAPAHASVESVPEEPAEEIEAPVEAQVEAPFETSFEAAINVAVEAALEPVPDDIPDDIPDDLPEEAAEEPVEPVETPEEPEAPTELEAPEPPAPEGPQRLTREEAKAMFREMELAKSAHS